VNDNRDSVLVTTLKERQREHCAEVRLIMVVRLWVSLLRALEGVKATSCEPEEPWPRGRLKLRANEAETWFSDGAQVKAVASWVVFGV
jgi:hypothetical protein